MFHRSTSRPAAVPSPPRLAALTACAGALLAAPARPAPFIAPAAYYGEDSRADLHETAQPRWRRLAESTVALFQDSDVEPDGGGAVRLKTVPFESLPSMSAWNKLCKDERFYGQPSGAVCSGFLVAPDIVATAGHCVASQERCRSLRFVFGFAISRQGAAPGRVDAGDVYGCARLLGREEVARGADWALVRLDRPVAGRLPLEINATGLIKESDPVLTIGYPSGLPVKVAAGGRVRDASPKDYFVTTLDAFHVGSGSPVFHAVTGRVEGILVSGETDYEWSDEGSCWTAQRCPEDGCRGEYVTRMSVPASRLPARGGEPRVDAARTLATLKERAADGLIFP